MSQKTWGTLVYIMSNISLPQNHHTGHRMLMEINGHYWVPISHNGPTPYYSTNILMLVAIPYVVAANACNKFQPPSVEISMLFCTKHIIPISSK